MRNVTNDHTAATTESVFHLAEALNMEIAGLAMASKGSPEIEGRVLDRLSLGFCFPTLYFKALRSQIEQAFKFEREVEALMKQGAVGELEVTTPAKLSDLELLVSQTSNNSWPTHARAA